MSGEWREKGKQRDAARICKPSQQLGQPIPCPVPHSPRPEFTALTVQEGCVRTTSCCQWSTSHGAARSGESHKCPPPPAPKVSNTRRCSTPDPNSQSKKLAQSPPLGTHRCRGQTTGFNQGAFSIFIGQSRDGHNKIASRPSPPCSHWDHRAQGPL